MTQEFEKNKPFVITICSGKAGVGKSVLAANIAYKIASRNLSVLLWDADFFSPNLHLILGVEPNLRLSEVLNGNSQVSNVVHSVNENLDLLCNNPNGFLYNSNPNIVLSLYEEILADSNLNYDFIIIDCPSGFSNEILQCCNIADLISIVINDEPTTLIDAYALIKILLNFLDKDHINMLVNNVIDFEDADEMSYKLNLACQKFLDNTFDYLGFVPHDMLVKRSIRDQSLFSISEPDSDVSNKLDEICNNILSKLFVYEV